MGAKNSNLCVDTNFSKQKLSHEDDELLYTVCHMKGRSLASQVAIC